MGRQRLSCFAFLVAVFITFYIALPHSSSAAEKQNLRIENVYTESSSFTPENNEQLMLHFKISQASEVTLSIYDSLHREVARPLDTVLLQAGNHQITWNGKDAEGTILPYNYYLYTLEAKNDEEESVRYDPSDITGGKQTGIQNITYNKKEDTVFFTLQQDAIINLRVGLIDGGPMMTTLIDWLPLTAGSHTITWNGKDNTGAVDLKNVRKLDINGPAYSLPMNSIILKGTKQRKQPGFLSDDKTTGNTRPITIDPTKRMMYNHWQHPRNKCYDPQVAIEFPKDQKYDSEGLPLVDGPLRTTVTANAKDRQFLLEQRFEVVLYVDFLFSHEEESGYFPYFWTWDPQGIEGIHYITAMLRGYEGHFAASTVKVHIRQHPPTEQ